MNAPAVVMAVLMLIGLLVAAHDHGKPRKPMHFPNALIGVAIEILILWWGGFWR